MTPEKRGGRTAADEETEGFLGDIGVKDTTTNTGDAG